MRLVKNLNLHKCLKIHGYRHFNFIILHLWHPSLLKSGPMYIKYHGLEQFPELKRQLSFIPSLKPTCLTIWCIKM